MAEDDGRTVVGGDDAGDGAESEEKLEVGDVGGEGGAGGDIGEDSPFSRSAFSWRIFCIFSQNDSFSV